MRVRRLPRIFISQEGPLEDTKINVVDKLQRVISRQAATIRELRKEEVADKAFIALLERRLEEQERLLAMSVVLDEDQDECEERIQEGVARDVRSAKRRAKSRHKKQDVSGGLPRQNITLIGDEVYVDEVDENGTLLFRWHYGGDAL